MSYFKPKPYKNNLNNSQLRKSRKKSDDEMVELKKDLFNVKFSK